MKKINLLLLSCLLVGLCFAAIIAMNPVSQTNTQNSIYDQCIAKGGTANNCTNNIRDAYTWCSINQSGSRNQCIENFDPEKITGNKTEEQSTPASAISAPTDSPLVYSTSSVALQPQPASNFWQLCAEYAKSHYSQQELAVSLNLLLQADNPDMSSVFCYMTALGITSAGCSTDTKCIRNTNKDKINKIIGKPENNNIVSPLSPTLQPDNTSIPDNTPIPDNPPLPDNPSE